MKVALFSLGNMCTHSACAQALMKLGLVEKLRRLSSSPDAQVQKHCARIQVSVAIPTNTVSAYSWAGQYLNDAWEDASMQDWTRGELS